MEIAENNMGNISKAQCRRFFGAVKKELTLDIGFGITPTAPSICLGNKILLCENDIQYPWFSKQMILHEITHHLIPEDKVHGSRFHGKYAELVNRFLAGKDEGELDPQAELFGWFLEHGWIPPEELGMKLAEAQKAVRERIIEWLEPFVSNTDGYIHITLGKEFLQALEHGEFSED